MVKSRSFVLRFFIFSIFLFASFFFAQSVFADGCQAGNNCIVGYGWSSNFGWIDFNCRNLNACATGAFAGPGGVDWGVQMDPSGYLSGYAWSPNMGWISFNAADVAGCPSGSCSALVSRNGGVNGSVTGWARACSGTVNGNCTGASRTDGWDGWIELSGTNHGTNGAGGVTYDSTIGSFKGYAWGGTATGWLQFDTSSPVQCSGCAAVGTLRILRVDQNGAAMSLGSTLARYDTQGFQTANPLDYSAVPAGTHSAQVSGTTGYLIDFVTCDFTGTTDCTPSSAYTASGLDFSTPGYARYPNINLVANQKTKIVFRYRPAPSVIIGARLAGSGLPCNQGIATPITQGSQAEICWIPSNVAYCTATGGDAGWPAASTGPVPGGGESHLYTTSALPGGSYTFTISCGPNSSVVQVQANVVLPVTGGALALSCSFQPPNSPITPAIGRPVTLNAVMTGGTPPYTTIQWTDSDSYNQTFPVTGNSASITRVYSVSGQKTIVATVTDSLGATASCTLQSSTGPDVKMTPGFIKEF